MWEAAGRCRRQQVFPVLSPGGEPRGLVDLDPRVMAPSQELHRALTADLMAPFVSVSPGAGVEEVARVLAERGLGQVPVVEGGRILGYVGEGEVARAWLAAAPGGAPGAG